MPTTPDRTAAIKSPFSDANKIDSPDRTLTMLNSKHKMKDSHRIPTSSRYFIGVYFLVILYVTLVIVQQETCKHCSHILSVDSGLPVELNMEIAHIYADIYVLTRKRPACISNHS